MNTARLANIFLLRRSIVKFLRAVFIIIVLVAFAGTSRAQTTAKPSPQSSGTPSEIMEALGKLKLSDMKKAVPRGTETAIKQEPGSRLSQVGAVTKFTEPGGEVAYYFNRAGILVSAQTKAKKLIPKETLMREIKGLEFKKHPPNQISAAFVRRSPKVIQGFYLSKDDKYVQYTTYDYLQR
jgi:hypothetical protein